MKLDVFTRVEVFDELKSEWNPLLKRSQKDSIFSTWEWQSIWWDAYQPGRLWVITCRTDNGRLVGIAPWFIDDERTIRGIGCEDVTDYIDVIVDSEFGEQVLNCFATFLRDCQSEFDAIEICNIPQDSPTLEKFPAFLNQHGFDVETEIQDVCPLFEVPHEWKGYLDLLDKKQRHELRRKMRKAGGANHEVDWYIVDENHNLEEVMEQFLKLMAASDAEKREFLQNPQHVKFFNQFVPVAMQNGWLQMIFLTVDGNPAAAYYNFDYNREILVYNSGLDPETYGSMSPGIVLLAHNIRYAIENNYRVFNFLRGDETYKYHMGGQDTTVHKLSARSR